MAERWSAENKEIIYYKYLDLIQIKLTSELNLAHDTTDSGSVSYIKFTLNYRHAMHAKGYVPETIYMHLTYDQSSCHQEISAPKDSPPREVSSPPSTKTKLIQVY